MFVTVTIAVSSFRVNTSAPVITTEAANAEETFKRVVARTGPITLEVANVVVNLRWTSSAAEIVTVAANVEVDPVVLVNAADPQTTAAEIAVLIFLTVLVWAVNAVVASIP